jgi:hypothetical protein
VEVIVVIVFFWFIPYCYVQEFDADLGTFGFDCFYVFLFQGLLGNKEIKSLVDFLGFEFEEQGVVA